MKIEVENSGMRIDKYLMDKTDFSRSKIQKLINDDKIVVNGKTVKASYTLKEDDVIDIVSTDSEDMHVEAENIPLDIIYEDEYLIVVNKPSGMVVHPAPGNYSGTLVNALMYHCSNNLSSCIDH